MSQETVIDEAIAIRKAAECKRIRRLLRRVFDVVTEAQREDGAAMVAGKDGAWYELVVAEMRLRMLLRPEPGKDEFYSELDYYTTYEPRLAMLDKAEAQHLAAWRAKRCRRLVGGKRTVRPENIRAVRAEIRLALRALRRAEGGEA